MSNKSFRLQILPIPLIIAVFISCEQAENLTSERLVFSVETSDPAIGSYNAARDEYNISTGGGAFFSATEKELPSDSAFAPQGLHIIINLPGAAELIEVLLNPNGYRVETQITLAGGVIKIYHTNQAYLVINPEGDSLYAVYGEGIVSGGTEYFENISGLFYEKSTYRFRYFAVSGPDSVEISCKYELLVDF